MSTEADPTGPDVDRTIPASPAGEPRSRTDAAPTKGARVGRYTVLETLGAGGMGVVYAALDPELDRKLAIKVIDDERSDGGNGTGGDTSPLLREAQAMARVAHPNVIPVYDVGTHDGHVYVAMELIDGPTLGAWMEDNSDPDVRWPQALEYFIAAGAGLAAAHAMGLVHCDFKPDNVMVGSDGRPRVLDFGLAAVIGPDLSGVFARDGVRPGQRVAGTPAYMAPEQIEGRVVDARTDQFSFCVALHEALFGVRPFPGDSPAAIAFNVLRGEVRDAPPDSAVPPWMRRVILRGLAVDPAARHPDMSALLAALRRDPARTRRRVLTGAAAATFAGAAAWAIGTAGRTAADTPACALADAPVHELWNEHRRGRLRQTFAATSARFGVTTAQKTAAALERHVDAWGQARVDACQAHHVRAEENAREFDLRMACLDERKREVDSLIEVLLDADEAMIKHAVRATGALPAVSLCDDPASLDFGQGVDLTPDDPAVARRVEALRDRLARASASGAAGRYPAAASVARDELLPEAEAIDFAPLTIEVKRTTGALLEKTGEFDAAERLLTEAYFEALALGYDAEAAEAASVLVSTVGFRQARVDDGLAWHEHAEALAGVRGRRPEAAAVRHHNVAAILKLAHRHDEALEHQRRAVALYEESVGPEHSLTMNAISNLGSLYGDLGRYDEATEALTRASALGVEILGEGHPDLAAALNNLALVQEKQGRLDEALEAYGRALAIKQEAFGDSHPDVALVLNNIANVHEARGDFAAARVGHERALAIKEQAFGPDHPSVGITLSNLAIVLVEEQEFEVAIEHYARSLSIFETTLGADHTLLGYPLSGLAEAHLLAGRAKLALPFARRAVELRERLDEVADRERAESSFVLARAIQSSGGSRAEARSHARRARDLYAASGPVAAEALREVDAWLADNG